LNIDSLEEEEPSSTVRGSFVRHDAGGVNVVVSPPIRKGVKLVVEEGKATVVDRKVLIVVNKDIFSAKVSCRAAGVMRKTQKQTTAGRYEKWVIAK
jgi:hypothetical protein